MPRLDLFARSLIIPEGEFIKAKYNIGKSEGFLRLSSDIKFFDNRRKEKLRKILRYIEEFVFEIEYSVKVKPK